MSYVFFASAGDDADPLRPSHGPAKQACRLRFRQDRRSGGSGAPGGIGALLRGVAAPAQLPAPSPSLALLLALLATSAVAPSLAAAQGRGYYFRGNQSALTGRAQSTTSNDVGALWYNPAGLAGNTATSIDATGTAFVLRRRAVRRGLVTRLPSGDEVAKDVDASFAGIVAPSVGMIREVRPGLSLGLASFIAQSDSMRLVGEADADLGNGERVRSRLTVEQNLATYHIGPGFGLKLGEHWRIGASLFAAYEQSSVNGLGVLSIGNGDDVFAGSLSVFRNRATLGLEAVAGTQWLPTPDWNVGFAVRAPRYVVLESVDNENSIIRADAEGGLDVSLDRQAVDSHLGALVTPLVLQLGVTKRFSRGTLSIDGDVGQPLGGSELQRRRKFSWNARVGGTLDITPQWTLGGGIGTNHSDFKPPEIPLDSAIDFYTATMAVQKETPICFRKNGDDTNPDLMLTTLLSVKYGIGIGEAGAVVGDVESGSVGTSERSDLIFHDVTIYLGSGIRF